MNEHRMNRKTLSIGLVLPLLFVLLMTPPFSLAAAQVPAFVGLGDSVGEGVQSANACARSQLFSYLNLVAKKLDATFPLPWIITSPIGWVGDTRTRARLFDRVPGLNLAVSGTDVHSLIHDRADALSEEEIDSETDLVLYPRQGSQLEIAEALYAQLSICWIGNNDILSAVISFDKLDASQLTPIQEFEADFHEIVQRLVGPGQRVVFGNIPDITHIAFLVDREDLIHFLGADYGLEEGSRTSIIVMLMIRLGLDDGSLLENPDFVLDAEEMRMIQERVEAFNRIIDETAGFFGMPVADINGLYRYLHENPPEVFGITLTTRFLGGLFSLDGVHPSNMGHALLANAFIRTMNAEFELDVPTLGAKEFFSIFLADPHIDKDGDGYVRGRPLAGLLETLGPFLGISGDEDDRDPMVHPGLSPENPGAAFMREYSSLHANNSHAASGSSADEAMENFLHCFGLKIFEKSQSQ